MKRRVGDKGVALLNVLVVVAIGAGLVQGMLLSQARAISTTSHSNDRAQARALAMGGIASVRTGLRRDMVDTPETDHLLEPWAKAAQTPVSFDFGAYRVVIKDARARFNVNSLRPNAVAETRVFAALLTALELPLELGPQIASIVARQGRLTSLAPLQPAGIDPRAMSKIAPYIAALPEGGIINLNAAAEPVLTAIFTNASAAKSLVARRAAKGFLDRSDLVALGLTQPLLAGFRSDAYDVTVTATVGQVTQSVRRRILRFPKLGTLMELPLE